MEGELKGDPKGEGEGELKGDSKDRKDLLGDEECGEVLDQKELGEE